MTTNTLHSSFILSGMCTQLLGEATVKFASDVRERQLTHSENKQGCNNIPSYPPNLNPTTGGRTDREMKGERWRGREGKGGREGCGGRGGKGR